MYAAFDYAAFEKFLIPCIWNMFWKLLESTQIIVDNLEIKSFTLFWHFLDICGGCLPEKILNEVNSSVFIHFCC